MQEVGAGSLLEKSGAASPARPISVVAAVDPSRKMTSRRPGFSTDSPPDHFTTRCRARLRVKRHGWIAGRGTAERKMVLSRA
jgi:hypothetical protein